MDEEERDEEKQGEERERVREREKHDVLRNFPFPPVPHASFRLVSPSSPPPGERGAVSGGR